VKAGGKQSSAYSSTLKMEAICSSETSVDFQRTTWRYISEDLFRSTTDSTFCIHQILEKKWEYIETVRQLFMDFKKAYGSVRREVLYSILTEFSIPMKLVRLIKMCLNEHAVKSM
jgi:hypothetical protein